MCVHVCMSVCDHVTVKVRVGWGGVGWGGLVVNATQQVPIALPVEGSP